MNYETPENSPGLSAPPRDNVQRAKDFAQHAADDARAAAENAMVRSEEFVRANPMPAVLSAFAIGFVLGVLVTRRDEEEEPVHRFRNAVHDALAPLAGMLREQYGHARSAADDAESALKNATRKFKFW